VVLAALRVVLDPVQLAKAKQGTSPTAPATSPAQYPLSPSSQAKGEWAAGDAREWGNAGTLRAAGGMQVGSAPGDV
jgi:hypothetical protein